MKNLPQAILQNVFVAFTALAAWLHSAWVFSTSFGGNAPDGDTGRLLMFYLPGALLAFALDIGLLAVSVKLRHRRTWPRVITFGSLAVFQFYLQWQYLIQHVPPVVLAAGVRDDWRTWVQTIADLRILIVPLLLPLALILYTAEAEDREPERAQDIKPAPVQEAPAEISEAPQVAAPAFLLSPNPNGHETQVITEP